MSVRLSGDPVVRATLILVGILFVPYVVPILSEGAMLAYGGIYNDLPLLLLGIAVYSYRLGRFERRERRFWLLMSAGWIAWLAVRLLWITVPIDLRGQGFDLLQDVLYLFFYLWIALAIMVRPHTRRGPGVTGLLAGLEATGTVVFMFGLLTYLVLLPGALDVQGYLTYVPSLSLYVFLDLYLTAGFLLARRAAPTRRWQRVYTLLAATAGLWALTDGIEALQYAEVMTYTRPGTLQDLLWFTPFITAIAAGRARESGELVEEESPAPPASDGPIRRLAGVWGSPLMVYAVVFPVVHLGAYRLGLLDEAVRDAREICLLVTLLLLGGMAIAYQWALTRENRRLEIEHRFMNEQLQIAQRMEVVGRMAGGIAHDFNNLLTVIRGCCDLLDEDLIADNGGLPGARDYIRKMRIASERGAALTARLMEVGSHRHVRRDVFDVNSMVMDTENMITRVLGEDIELVTSLDKETAPVKLGHGQLEQILLNLVINSRDAMPEGGRLEIRTKDVKVEAAEASLHGARAGRHTMLEVADDGSGMDPEVRAHIFEPFFTTKGPGKGTGLGLATIYGIVSQVGGYVDVESEPGQGTQVRVYLPAWEELAADQEAGEPLPSITDTGRETILLVEDEDPVRATMAAALRRRGYVVVEAGDGKEALGVASLHAGTIHLLLTDVVMPLMGGPELAERLAVRRPETKVLFVSGYTGPAEKLLQRFSRPVEILSKPFEPTTLVNKVREVLDEAPA